MSIIYIDDDEDDIYLFTSLVNEIDDTIQLCSYTDGMEAVESLRHTLDIPDFIFMDMNMPRVNGYQLLGLLKQDDYLKSIKVVMYSTSKSQAEVEEVYAKGAYRFIRKASTVAKAKADISSILQE